MQDLPEVLIIDDNDELRSIAGRMLEISGYNVFTAPNRDEALHILRNNLSIDNILLDVTMPGMTLSEFIDHLREWNQYFTVIFVTGGTDDKVVSYLQSNELINFKFLQKPFGIEELRHALRKIEYNR